MACLSAAVLVTAWSDDSPLGAPSYWPWLLTGLQVLALWSAGTGRWWGWLLGGSVQVPWIAYALVTTQVGFVPGCAISACVQLCSFCRHELATAHDTASATGALVGSYSSHPREATT